MGATMRTASGDRLGVAAREDHRHPNHRPNCPAADPATVIPTLSETIQAPAPGAIVG
jgi:hypothetical protein